MFLIFRRILFPALYILKRNTFTFSLSIVEAYILYHSCRTTIKYVDDDEVNSSRTIDFSELETGEDAPMIAGIIDERPHIVRKLEVYQNNNLWAPIAEDENRT